jgi:hypothetical protein
VATAGRSPNFGIDVRDSAQRLWQGTVWLSPPILGGWLRTYDGAPTHEVRGWVVGRRVSLFENVDRVVVEMGDRLMTNAPWLVRKVTEKAREGFADNVLVPWARASLGFDTQRAEIGFVAETWKPRTTVVDLDPRLTPWLRDYLADAERRVEAHAHEIVSVSTAWEVARLHLVLSEAPQSAEAVRRGIELLRESGLTPDDRRAGERLAAVLPAASELRDLATELVQALAAG